MIAAFIHIPKTAGITMNLILQNSFGINHCDAEPIVKKNGLRNIFTRKDFCLVAFFYPRLKSIAGHSLRAFSDINDHKIKFKYFTFLRDPFNRCISFYMFKKRVGDECKLDDIIEWTSNAMTRQIAGKADFALAREVIQKNNMFCGLVEKFLESLILLQRLHVPDIRIRYLSKNVTPKSSEYMELLSNEALKVRIYEKNKLDLKLYHYVSKILMPDYRLQYGPTLEKDISKYSKNLDDFNRINVIAAKVYNHLTYVPAVRLIRLNKCILSSMNFVNNLKGFK